MRVGGRRMEAPNDPIEVLEGEHNLVPQTESDPDRASGWNRLLQALIAPRWVGDGDRTRDIQVHNLVSGWCAALFREWKRRMQGAGSVQGHKVVALCPVFSTWEGSVERLLSSILAGLRPWFSSVRVETERSRLCRAPQLAVLARCLRARLNWVELSRPVNLAIHSQSRWNS